MSRFGPPAPCKSTPNFQKCIKLTASMNMSPRTGQTPPPSGSARTQGTARVSPRQCHRGSAPRAQGAKARTPGRARPQPPRGSWNWPSGPRHGNAPASASASRWPPGHICSWHGSRSCSRRRWGRRCVEVTGVDPSPVHVGNHSASSRWKHPLSSDSSWRRPRTKLSSSSRWADSVTCCASGHGCRSTNSISRASKAAGAGSGCAATSRDCAASAATTTVVQCRSASWNGPRAAISSEFGWSDHGSLYSTGSKAGTDISS